MWKELPLMIYYWPNDTHLPRLLVTVCSARYHVDRPRHRQHMICEYNNSETMPMLRTYNAYSDLEQVCAVDLTKTQQGTFVVRRSPFQSCWCSLFGRASARKT